MKPPELIELLKNLDPDKEIICQVVSKDGGAWNMFYEFKDVPGSTLISLSVSHPKLKYLPSVNDQN